MRRPILLTPTSQLRLPMRLHCSSFSPSGQFCSCPSPSTVMIPRALPNKPPPCLCLIQCASWGDSALDTATNTEWENADERDCGAFSVQMPQFTGNGTAHRGHYVTCSVPFASPVDARTEMVEATTSYSHRLNYCPVLKISPIHVGLF